MGTLAAFATFGVGFLFRPLGGVIFGHFGDRLGRKRMLMLTVWMMGGATALIGILPSFASIGWWAPVLLVTLRAIQGFAVGGEWGGAALLSVESAPKNKKAFYSSGVQVGYGVGLLLSTGLVSLISQLTTDEQFLSWGWRIPFIFSIVLVIAALWVRNGMEESAEFEKQQQEKPVVKKRLPVMEALIQHPGAFLKIIALRLCELLTMYIVTAFALNYSTQNLGLPRELFLNIGLLVGGISCLTIPCFAWLADRFGRRRVYITGALIGTLSAWPFLWHWKRSRSSGSSFLPSCWPILRMTWWCVCSSRCLPNSLAHATATAVLALVIRWRAWWVVDLPRLLPPRW
jgi:MHS family shikimate/dehydroshikimate transporter-like MFS transporter